MYDVIYADPPWKYDFSKSDSRKIENQYPTMTVGEICSLQVPANKNSVLFLWGTTAKLVETLKVMNAWGFTYKSSLIWDKQIIGMGFWFRGQHEFLFVGTKGKFSPPLQKDRISSIYSERRTKHSKKPDYIRDRIDSWYPDTKKLEMFCRDQKCGWDAFGNEIINSIIL